MDGQDVLTSDDHKLGTVVAEREGFVILESGHLFKSRHAVPTEFLHEHDWMWYPILPVLEPDGAGRWRFPAGRPRIPLQYSLRATT